MVALEKQAASKVTFTCPMHPEIRQAGAGSCPKCGMALEPLIPPAAAATQWACPMHPQVIQDQPGSCPICGMALEPRSVSNLLDEENPELKDMTRRFWLAAVVTVPLVFLAMGDLLPGAPVSQLMSVKLRI